MLAPAGLVEAVSKRREHRTNQYDGHQRSLENTTQHGYTVPQVLRFSVMQITTAPNLAGQLLLRKLL